MKITSDLNARTSRGLKKTSNWTFQKPCSNTKHCNMKISLLFWIFTHIFLLYNFILIKRILFDIFLLVTLLLKREQQVDIFDFSFIFRFLFFLVFLVDSHFSGEQQITFFHFLNEEGNETFCCIWVNLGRGTVVPFLLLFSCDSNRTFFAIGLYGNNASCELYWIQIKCQKVVQINY